jgi:hypothetical protein
LAAPAGGSVSESIGETTILSVVSPIAACRSNKVETRVNESAAARFAA